MNAPKIAPANAPKRASADALAQASTRARDLHAVTLQWHAAFSVIELEAFQTWALLTLKDVLAFDRALWGVETAAGGPPMVGSLHLHQLTPQAVPGYIALRHGQSGFEGASGTVARASVGDARWKSSRHADLREHAQRHGLMHSMTLRLPDAGGGAQLLVLARSRDPGFTSGDATVLRHAAPHLMQAFANRRLLDVAQSSARKRSPARAAIVDRSGGIHDADETFISMLRREWSDWGGELLPAPLQDVLSRRKLQPWRFVGEQVTADFLPVQNLFLMTVRIRHAGDVLTSRERDIARHYAEGSNYREIACSLSLAPATVRAHLRNVFAKLKINNKAHLAAFMQ